MADEKTIQRRPRGTPIDRGIALMQAMDDETLRNYGAVVRGFCAARIGRSGPAQAMLELGQAAGGDDASSEG